MKLCIFLFSLLGVTATAGGQIVRLGAPARPHPELALGSLGISASPSTISLTLVAGGQAFGSSAISIQTAANLSVLSSLSLYAFFTNSAALSSSSGDTIPASMVYGRCPTGSPTAFTAFTQSAPFSAASGLQLYRTGNLVMLGSGRTDSLFLMIDLSATPQLPAGSYTGTLILQAQAL